DHAHNDFLEFWVDLGLIGLVALGILVGWILCRAWRGGGDDGGAWGGVAALLAIACVDFPFHRPAEWGLFWLLLGMLSTRRTGKCRYRTDG
ncbi:MAG: hypothetical protein M1436_08535, partial [Acidobacteria bacterium]|nr:hypothetical protein [Acidobacteriota bacterium]